MSDVAFQSSFIFFDQFVIYYPINELMEYFHDGSLFYFVFCYVFSTFPYIHSFQCHNNKSKYRLIKFGICILLFTLSTGLSFINMAPKLYVTVLSALGLAIGLTLVVLSAVLDKSYYSFCALIPLAMLSFPIIFCSPKPDSFEEETFLEMCGYFLTGFLLCCLIGSIVIMFRVNAITTLSLILCIIGICVIAGSVIWFSKSESDNSY